MASWNRDVIREFRASGGRVGGRFEGVALLLLHTRGARSGDERVTPLTYQAVGQDYAVFASFLGAPRDPDWFHNITATPDVLVDLGSGPSPARARVTHGAERQSIWDRQVAAQPEFARYATKAGREIPVVVLSPLG